MDSSKHDFIETLRPDGKKGIKVPKHIYEQIVKLIITALRESNEVTLTEILDLIKEHRINHPNLEFVSLHVKLDLEGKGFLKNIRSHVNPQRKHICITRRGRTQFGLKNHQNKRVDKTDPR
jgi:hypothetical protein